MTRKRLLSQRLLEHCRSRRLLVPGDRVLMAVSGGADSVVLLHLLRELQGALGVKLAVAHVYHGLLPNQETQGALVATLARRLGLPFLERHIQSRQRGRSTEEVARTRRYEALREMAVAAGANRIATGHTATDQAETLILRMVRGSGPLGLSGILSATREGVVRPLLCATREEVRAFARHYDIPFLEDPSNADMRFLRNRVRAEVMPLLRRLNPRVDFTLAALAEDLDAVALLDGEAEVPTGSGPMAGTSGDEVQVGIDRDLPGPLRTYRMRNAWVRLTGAVRGLSREHLLALVRLWDAPGGSEAHLPSRVMARREGNVLRLWREPDDRPPPGSRRRPPRVSGEREGGIAGSGPSVRSAGAPREPGRAP